MAPIWKENQFVQTQKKTAHDLKNQDARIGSNSREGFNSRIQLTSNEAKLVLRNLDPGPHLNWASVLLNIGDFFALWGPKGNKSETFCWRSFLECFEEM
jgi:hypothetical protein